MKCHIHNDRDAVATCKSCGKGLCSECTSEFQPPACRPCAELQSKQAYLARKKTLIVTAVIGAIGFFCGLGINEEAGIFGGLLLLWVFCGIYWGWSYVKPMLFGTILGMSATAMFRPSAMGTSFLVGAMLTSVAIGLGMFIGPFLFAKNVYEFIRDKNAYEVLKSG